MTHRGSKTSNELKGIRYNKAKKIFYDDANGTQEDPELQEIFSAETDEVAANLAGRYIQGPSRICLAGECCLWAYPSSYVMEVDFEDLLWSVKKDKSNSKPFSTYLEADRFYIGTWFSSFGNTCVFRVLQGVFNLIVYIHVVRLENHPVATRALVDKIWKSDLESGQPPSFHAELEQLEKIDRILHVALRHWAHSAKLYDLSRNGEMDPALIWPHLNQATMYLGMAFGPWSTGEGARMKALKQHRKRIECEKDFVQAVLLVLKKEADRSRINQKDIIRNLVTEPAVFEAFEAYRKASSSYEKDKEIDENDEIDALERLIKKILKNDPSARNEVVRISRHKMKP
ncbi:hypothetical protein G7069_02475 [Lysobacter sp. HDW10]|uniref:hypothetical protein n=1 Tax=Lysobacter sp. HDW10 TaxID=2714936 RepID=UPI00140D52C9|nr:hypothetical protein [Lysobacter sp. HDW10]QIK80564.1 hypothetical protein G7069_02475 [Lysobacter sp. HDW10]